MTEPKVKFWAVDIFIAVGPKDKPPWFEVICPEKECEVEEPF